MINIVFNEDDGTIISQRKINLGDRVKIISNKEGNKNINYAEIMANRSIEQRYFKEAFGSFYFANYNKLMERINNNYALVFRFIYLCTFTDYNGCLKFGLLKDNMKESDFCEVFKMKMSMITKLKKELYGNELIYKKDNGIFVNENFCVRGNIKDNTYKRNCSRVFDNGIKKIYNASLITEHKRLGVVVALLPYMNKYYNIICINTEETELENIRPLTFKNICKAVNFDYRYYDKLVKVLVGTTVNNEPMVLRVQNSECEFYVINPCMFYTGYDIDSLKYLIGLFKIKYA